MSARQGKKTERNAPQGTGAAPTTEPTKATGAEPRAEELPRGERGAGHDEARTTAARP